MLDSLKQAGKNISRELNRAWENLSDGWREVLSRSSNSLTHFQPDMTDDRPDNDANLNFPRWSLLACEIEETESHVIVRIELPGMGKQDISLRIEGTILCITGEKRFVRESPDSQYHVMERAYGTFQRRITLPRHVDADGTTASFVDGVLLIRLPKASMETTHDIPIG